MSKALSHRVLDLVFRKSVLQGDRSSAFYAVLDDGGLECFHYNRRLGCPPNCHSLSDLIYQLDSNKMRVVEFARFLSIVPGSYDNVRFHHVALGYMITRSFFASVLYTKISEGVLSVLSRFSESCIPLIHRGLVPDFIIRWGIRLQLQ